jgi:hypothetical protein
MDTALRETRAGRTSSTKSTARRRRPERAQAIGADPPRQQGRYGDASRSKVSAGWDSVAFAPPDTSPMPCSARTAAISTATWLPYPVAPRAPTTATELTHVSLRSAAPRSHNASGRASPRSSSCVGHSASPGTISRNPTSCQAASLAVLGISPSRSRHRCIARPSAVSACSPASSASPSASAPVTSASTSAAVRVRSAAPCVPSPSGLRLCGQRAGRHCAWWKAPLARTRTYRTGSIHRQDGRLPGGPRSPPACGAMKSRRLEVKASLPIASGA